MQWVISSSMKRTMGTSGSAGWLTSASTPAPSERMALRLTSPAKASAAGLQVKTYSISEGSYASVCMNTLVPGRASRNPFAQPVSSMPVRCSSNAMDSLRLEREKQKGRTRGRGLKAIGRDENPSLVDRAQIHRIGGERVEEHDQRCAVFNFGQAREAHLGARREIGRLFDEGRE